MVYYAWGANDQNRTLPPYSHLIKHHRIRRRLSQGKLAALLNIDHSYISRIENGTRQPSKQLTQRLAEVFDLRDFELMEFWYTLQHIPVEPVGPNTNRVIRTIYESFDGDIHPAIADSIVNMVQSMGQVMSIASPAPNAVHNSAHSYSDD